MQQKTSFIHALGATVLLGLMAGAASAADEGGTAALKAMFPNADSIEATPVSGVYEIREGYQLRYTDATGRYGFTQDLVDATTGENLTESKRRALRKELFDSISNWDTIDFIPENAAHKIVVFTDISCGYCRQLHGQIGLYNDKGIGVHYLAFPRAGAGSETWNQMQSIWCSDDRRATITLAKAGLPVTSNACDSDSVAKHVQLGAQLGLGGTPMLLTADGQIIPGYVPPDQLQSMLNATPEAAGAR